MKHVMFVDDEIQVLESLRDALRPHRREWRMAFAEDGPTALAEMERQPYDVVVSDMRMPGMDGAALLGHVHRRHPDTVRIVLSGYAEAEAVARAATVAHRFLAKPCDVGELTHVVARSCALNELTRGEELRRAATGAAKLPAAPLLYARLTALLADRSSTAHDVADVVGQDVAMVAKVLQLANSAFFGRSRQVTRVDEAVVYLGLDTVRTLVLTAGAFDALQSTRPIPHFRIEDVQAHGLHVGHVVNQMLKGHPEREAGVAGALLHDLGLLVLAAREPEHLGAVLETAARERRPAVEVETEAGGGAHPALGAHLLSLWGLAHDVIEPVAFHHDPRASAGRAFGAVAAVHIADALVGELEAAAGPAAAIPPPPLDVGFAEEIGVAGRLDEWRALAAAAAIV